MCVCVWLVVLLYMVDGTSLVASCCCVTVHGPQMHRAQACVCTGRGWPCHLAALPCLLTGTLGSSAWLCCSVMLGCNGVVSVGLPFCLGSVMYRHYWGPCMWAYVTTAIVCQRNSLTALGLHLCPGRSSVAYCCLFVERHHLLACLTPPPEL